MMLHLVVDDPDAVAETAVAAGATAEMPVQDMFWGEHYGVLLDPFGHRWAVSTQREALTPDKVIESSRDVDFPPPQDSS